jgi:hypothetical protein
MVLYALLEKITNFINEVACFSATFPLALRHSREGGNPVISSLWIPDSAFFQRNLADYGKTGFWYDDSRKSLHKTQFN